MTDLELDQKRLIDLATRDTGGGFSFIGDRCTADIREKWKNTTVGSTAEITHKASGRRFRLEDDGRGGRLLEVE